MLPVIEQLLALQDCDRRLIQLRTELGQIAPRRQLLLSKAAQSQSSYTSAKDAALKIESERKRLELEVETKQAQIDKCLTQQAQTKKNEEYQAFTHQIGTIKEAIRQLEDQEIELMERAEVAAKEVAAANAEAKQLKAVADGQISDLAKAEEGLKQRVADLETERKRLAADVIDESALAKYERLLKSKGPNAVVGIEHSVCGGCHMQLPTQITLDCRAMENLVSCINCGRLLYYSAGMTLAVSA